LNIYYPEGVDVEHEKVQSFIRHSLTETMRFEAKKYLPARTLEIAQKHKLDVGKVTVRNNKTRWGSCSGKNNISLNIHLMRLPDELIDYVIYHELVHTKVKRHGRPFWMYLETLLPGAIKLDKKLNKYHLVYW
jgi:predicted metal-dependent hydrolase